MQYGNHLQHISNDFVLLLLLNDGDKHFVLFPKYMYFECFLK